MAASIPMRSFIQHQNICRLMSRCLVSESIKVTFHTCAVLCDTDVTAPSLIHPEAKAIPKAEKISRAMKAYLERGKAHDEMIAKEVEQYEIGKRHLANIMGEDPDSFTQTDIDRSIQYLLPSGLFDKKARPKLKHPMEVFPAQKAVQFDRSGRPFHYLFYTGKPNYYEIMHEAAAKFDNLTKLERKMEQKGMTIPTDSDLLVQLKQSVWLEEASLMSMVLEKLSEDDVRRFHVVMERLAQHPLAYREREFIMKYRKPLISQNKSLRVPQVEKTEEGTEYSESFAKRKASRAAVKLWIQGTGKFQVNNTDLHIYFPRSLDRQQVLFPLQLINKLGLVDIEASVEHGGPSGQAGAIRLGVSKCLTSFVDEDTTQKMRIAGLLTSDPRIRERKKPGQPGARRKPTWKKR